MRISLIDANDSPPRFLQDKYRAVVDEGAEKFEPELKVQARDKDKTSKITYALVGGNELGLFAVDADTGEITIKSPVDMTNATQDWIGLTIQASDGTFVDSALVNITVRDVNNNAPVFPHDIYTASIAEISPIGKHLWITRALTTTISRNPCAQYCEQSSIKSTQSRSSDTRE